MATEYKLPYTASEIYEKLVSMDNLDTKLKLKADLIDGKIPLTQLPDNIGSGEGGTLIQKQTDYNQNDDTQVDYIKNRPFYDNRITSYYSYADDSSPVSFNYELMEYSFYKVSDLILSEDQIANEVSINITNEDGDTIDVTSSGMVISISANDFIATVNGDYTFLFANKSGSLPFEMMGYELSLDVPEGEEGVYLVLPLNELPWSDFTCEIVVSNASNFKQIDPKYIPKNAISWEDLKDKPFYEDGWSVDWDFTPTDTYIQPGCMIEWDGSDTGTSFVIPANEDLNISPNTVFYRVADSIDCLEGCIAVTNNTAEDSEEALEIYSEDVVSIYDTDSNIVGTYAAPYMAGVFNIERAATAYIAEGVEVTFPAPGLYFRTDGDFRIFYLFNMAYEIIADMKLYKIADSVNTSLAGSKWSIMLYGQVFEEAILENNAETVIIEMDDGSSAVIPYLVNAVTDNTIFDLSDLVGVPLVIKIPKAGLYMLDFAETGELPEGSSMKLSNQQVVKIDSKFVPRAGCPTYSGGQIIPLDSDYLVCNFQALLANLTNNSVDFKKGCYDIEHNATEFILTFSGADLTLDNNLVISIATGHSGGMDLESYTSDISVEISGLKSIKSGSWYTVYCVYSKPADAWTGTVISSAGSDYELPVATATTLGGIKVGNNLTISNGVLSADVPSADWYTITNKPSLYTQSEINTKLNAKQNTSNLVTSISASSTDTQYPSAKLLYTKLNTKQTSNLVTSISSSSTDSQYPSAKLLYTKLNEKQNTSNLVTSISSSSTDTQYPSAKLLYTTKTDLESKIGNGSYTLPEATSTTLGGIKVGSNLSISNGVLSANIPSLAWSNITDKPSLYTQSEVNTKLNTKQDISNLVASVGSSSTDTQYPSAKLLYTTKTNLESQINTTKTNLESQIANVYTKSEIDNIISSYDSVINDINTIVGG